MPDRHPSPNILRGAAAMALSSLCFVLMDAILREMAKAHGLGMVVWARYLTQVLFVFALLPFLGGRRAIVTRRPFLHIARGVLLVITTICLVMALRELPFATTYAITLTNPIIATGLALAFLGERPTLAMFGLIVLGFLGVLIILSPGSPAASPAALWALGMALANACLHVLTRFLGRDEEPFSLLFYIGLAALAVMSLGAPWFWTSLPLSVWGWMALVGAFGVGAHVTLVDAYRHAPTAIVAPMTYLQLVWAAGLGFVAFGEVPALRTVAGAALIVLSGVLLVRGAMQRAAPVRRECD
jgi:drug/metabolite transporter (DMT)-like permease